MKEYITAIEVGKILGVHPVTVSRLAKEGKLVHYVFGSRRKYKKEDIITFIEEAKRDEGRQSTTKQNTSLAY